MITSVSSSSLSQIRSGTILTINATRYVAVTPPVSVMSQLEKHFTEGNPAQSDGFTVVTMENGPLGEKTFVGCYEVNRLETLDRLEHLDDKLHVRFQGEYTTLTLPVEEVLDTPHRRLVRTGAGSTAGIFHASNQRYLMSPNLRLESPQLLYVTLPKSITTVKQNVGGDLLREAARWNERMARILQKTRSTIRTLSPLTEKSY